jgi:hypothetical protein
LASRISERAGRRLEARTDFIRAGADKIIGTTVLLDERGRRQERYGVLTLRNGRIVEMQGCRSRRAAERFARQTAGATGSHLFALVLRDGEAADPAAFHTAISTWRVGDEFVAGDELRRFRIIATIEAPEKQEGLAADEIWIVEPVEPGA